MSGITLRGVRKAYGDVEVLHGVDLDIPQGKMTVLLGPSGCGKSTLLRMIAGLEPITGGDLAIAGRRVNDVPAKQRGCAMVFQSYALYPHLSVYKNLAFPLTMAGQAAETIDTRVRAIAAMLQIEPYLDRLPRDLSGGQRQRVAMGRAIIREPDVYLFDEPLSNLDAELRVKMRLEIARLQRELGATMLFVTHDQVEAMTLAHQIVVMKDGHIEQVGAPLDIYRAPASRFVATFIGSPGMNIIDVTETLGQGSDRAAVLENGVHVPLAAWGSEAPAAIALRPEAFSLHPLEGGSVLTLDSGSYTVLGIEQLGDRAYCYLSTTIGEIAVAVSGGTGVEAVGSAQGLNLHYRQGDIRLFNASGRAIAG
ncbi:ATP-binding cassette domain-containing protein [Arsenicitalea aurantiaca]|uniref:ATP-binding cassette domain-containing protein n=1 Tax=Arsenicitalea aurantiaca TaxID=1783274 RepID=A0A433XL36_9HYPH|nr:ATP-binding cassette domain-containing protein [Arsenicitalea aurantiaca]RUT34799.1 ATP-binding cassette domain-containing protein [Arsenicitalea aurantiaca]